MNAGRVERIAAALRDGRPDFPDTTPGMRQFVTSFVAAAPELTDAQRGRVGRLLHGSAHWQRAAA